LARKLTVEGGAPAEVLSIAAAAGTRVSVEDLVLQPARKAQIPEI